MDEAATQRRSSGSKHTAALVYRLSHCDQDGERARRQHLTGCRCRAVKHMFLAANQLDGNPSGLQPAPATHHPDGARYATSGQEIAHAKIPDLIAWNLTRMRNLSEVYRRKLRNMVLIAKTPLIVRALTKTRPWRFPLPPARAVDSPQMMKRAMCRSTSSQRQRGRTSYGLPIPDYLRHYFRYVRSEGSSPAS